MVEASLVNMVETVGILIGVIIALQQLRDIKETNQAELEARQTQLHMNILAHTRTMEHTRAAIDFLYNQNFEDYNDWIEKYGPRNNPEAYATYVYVTGMTQNIGLLLKRKVIDAESISRQIRPSGILYMWDKIKPLVKYHRENVNPAAYEEFEYLVNEMRSILERRKAQSKTSIK